MPCMTQTSTNPLRAPHTPPHPHLQGPKTPPSTPEPTSHPRSHPAPPGPAEPNQGHPYVDLDAQDPSNPPSQTPTDPEHPPLTPTTIRDRDLLRATLKGRALSTPLGWYSLQESWTKLIVKALRDLTTGGNVLNETIVDLVLWRARQHAQGQHVWISPIEWGQALTHDTDTNVTRQGTIRLRRAPAERDHRADPNHPEQLEQATTPTRDTALRAAGLRTQDDDLPPPPTDSDHPPPEVWCTVLERGHYYVVAATATSSGPQWLVKGTDTMLAPGTSPPTAVGDLTTPHRVLRGVLQPRDKPPARALAQITSGRAGYHLGLAMLSMAQWIQRRWPSTGTVHWIWAIPTAHTQIKAGPDTRKDPPPQPQHSLTCGYHALHRVLCRVGLSRELAYPLPTTDQEVHQIRKLICEILAAAAEDGNLLLQTARPTTDHTSAPLRADRYTDTTHPPARFPPMPLPPRCPPGEPHTPTDTRTLRPRDTGLLQPPKQQHMPATDPPDGHPSAPPTLDNPHRPTKGSPTPHSTPIPPSDPHTPPAHTPENPGPPPPRPLKCSPRELFPPADANPHSLKHCRTPAQPSLEGEDHSPVPPTAAGQIGTPGRQVTAGPPQPPTPNLQPEDMPSILPAVAAAEAAAHKTHDRPHHSASRVPKITTFSSSSASSMSSTSYSDTPLPADLIHKATEKAKAAAARQTTGDPPTPKQATQAPRQHTGKPPTRHSHPHTSGPRSSSTSNRTPNQNPTQTQAGAQTSAPPATAPPPTPPHAAHNTTNATIQTQATPP